MKNNKYLFLIVLVALFTTIATLAGDAPLKAAIDGAHRGEADKARDQYRHPYEALTFFGIANDMTVVEILPSSGWYSAILGPYLKDRGHLVAAIFDNDNQGQWGDWMRKTNKAFRAKVEGSPQIYGGMTFIEYGPPAKASLGKAGSADMVLDFRNAHNWLRADAAAYLKSFHDVLKPGGVLGIVDHREKADKQTPANSPNNGYTNEDELIALVEAAGFQFVAKSEINANAKDTKNYPQGVWTLPPTYALGATDKEKYAAIGESDRMTLKFIKK